MPTQKRMLTKRLPGLGIALLLSLPLAVVTAVPTVYAAAPTITEFSAGITAGQHPFGMTVGPDGNLWFLESTSGNVGKITPTGTITEITTGLAPGANPQEIITGPDGNLWFTEYGAGKIARMTPAGVVMEFSTPTPSSQPAGLVAGPDGNIWFVEQSGDKIAKATPAGAITEYSLAASTGPLSITVGPDDNLWFGASNTVGRVTTSGVITPYSLGLGATALATSIVSGSDGNLWFSERGRDKIGMITTAGVVTEYGTGITASAGIDTLAVGPDGNVWFTEDGTNKIGKITTAGTVTESDFGITDGPYSIALGPDGNLWFTEGFDSKIGRLNLIPTVVNGDGSTTSTVTSEYDFSSFDYTVVNNQTLVVDGQIGDVVVQSGGTLKGTGSVQSVTVEAGGHVAPGNSPGCLNTGNLSFASGSSLDIELGGTTACSGYDQVTVTGTVDVTGATLNTLIVNAFVPSISDSFTIINNDGADAVTGTFSGLAEGAILTVDGVVFQISYLGGDGNDVVLTVQSVPPPGAPTAGLAATATNPLIPLGTSVLAAMTLFFIARRVRPAARKLTMRR